MGIGVSIFLIAAGAILKFALYDQFDIGVDLETVGVILMIVGGIGLVMALVLNAQRSRTKHVEERRPDR